MCESKLPKEPEITSITVEVLELMLDPSVKIYQVTLEYSDKQSTWKETFATHAELEAFHRGLQAAYPYSLPLFEIPIAVCKVVVPVEYDDSPTCPECGAIAVKNDDNPCYTCPNCGWKSGESGTKEQVKADRESNG